MRTEVRILFDTKDVPGGERTVLDPAGIGPDVVTITDIPILRQIEACVTLEEKDPRAPLLLKLLKEHGVHAWEYHEDNYTEEELDSARLLVMSPNNLAQIDGGVEWGMTYDFSEACPACWTGGRQTSAAFVNGEDLRELDGHRAGITYSWHFLLDDGLAEDLLHSGVTGFSFRNVYAVMPDKRQVKLRWKQLCADRTLPRMSPSTTGMVRERACPVCDRNGYFFTDEAPARVVYRASDLRGAAGVNASWENNWFSILDPDIRKCDLPRPWLVVNPKVRRVFRDAGVTAFDWLPIRVEE